MLNNAYFDVVAIMTTDKKPTNNAPMHQTQALEISIAIANNNY